jgi:hypothetical protein
LQDWLQNPESELDLWAGHKSISGGFQDLKPYFLDGTLTVLKEGTYEPR